MDERIEFETAGQPDNLHAVTPEPTSGRAPRTIRQGIPQTPATSEAPVRVVTPRAPKLTVRPMEEIFNLDPKHLNDKEKDAVVKFFQETIGEQQAYVRSLEENCKSAYEQARIMRGQLDEVKAEANYKINLLKQNVHTAFQNMQMINMEAK